jgi:hypothetical protein
VAEPFYATISYFMQQSPVLQFNIHCTNSNESSSLLRQQSYRIVVVPSSPIMQQ